MNNTESYLVEVPPSHQCDVCGCYNAPFYHTRWYIHLCGLICLYEFEGKYREEIDGIATKKLKGDGLNDM